MSETMPLNGHRLTATKTTLCDLPNGRVVADRFSTAWGESLYEEVLMGRSGKSIDRPISALEGLINEAAYKAVEFVLRETNLHMDLSAEQVASAAKWTAFSKVEDYLSTEETAILALRLEGFKVHLHDSGLEVYNRDGVFVGVFSFGKVLEKLA